MAFQPVPDTAQLRFHLVGSAGGALVGLQWFFSLYVRDTSGPWIAVQLQQLATYGAAWWDLGKNAGVPARSLCTGAWSIQEIRAIDIGAENGLSAVAPVVQATGNRATPNVPPSVPAIVQFVGDAGGSPKRGRIFWSGLNESDIDGDEYLLASRQALAQIFTDFRTDLNDVTAGGDAAWAQVLVSRNSGTAVDPTPKRIAVRRAAGVTNTLAGAIAVRQIVGAQRNRRLGE